MEALRAGIEDSDYSKIHAIAELATIPNYLFAADATVTFSFKPNK